MKRIEFIAPVEAMRGNLSGAQNLQYPTDNQGAYEGPVGSVNYARNYSPRFVGSKRASDGRKYFSVRTKSANHLTAKSKKAMAIMGGAGAMYAAIVRDKNSSLYSRLYAMYLKIQELGDQRTFRKWLMDQLRRGVAAQTGTIVVTGPLAPIDIDNPWCTISETPNVVVGQQTLVKFWDELAQYGFVLNAGSRKIIASEGNLANIAAIVAKPNYNVAPVAVATNGVELPEDIQAFKDSEGIWGKPCIVGSSSITGGQMYELMYIVIDGQKYALGSLVGLDPTLEIFTTICEAHGA